MHRDLNLENILVNFENEEDKNKINLLKSEIKINGFSLAVCKSQKDLCKSEVGATINMAPLILNKLLNKANLKNQKIEYDEKDDIWSLGILCYQMLIGKYPFDGFNLEELVLKIEEGNYKIPANLSKEAFSFLNSMLQYMPEKRLSASDLIKHAFLIKHIKDFTRIDLRKVQKNIFGHELKINIKNNTALSFFNEEDNLKLNNGNLNNEKINEILKLKEELNQSKKIIEKQKNTIIELQNRLKKYDNDSKIKSLNNIINQQIQQLKTLKLQLQKQNNNSDQNQITINRDQMKSVNFISSDQKVHFSVACLGSDLFVEIEKKLYEQYPEYLETNNYFLSQGKQILRFKTIAQNNIGNGFPVSLMVP